jgi:hypothetical protein
MAFQNYLNALEQSLSRRAQLENEIRQLLSDWSLGDVVNALQAWRCSSPTPQWPKWAI